MGDNKKGITERADKVGIGLASIKEQANLLSGKLNLTSAPGQGTIANVWLIIDAHKN